MKNYISMFIMIIVGFVLQTTIFRSLQIADVSPNILVILTAIAGITDCLQGWYVDFS